nr:hypothetical protein [Cohnella mopanensis]
MAELVITQHSQAWNLVFSRAKLMIVSDYGTRLWYIDIDGMTDEKLLQKFAQSDDIGVEMVTTTIGGRRMEGKGFFHPNPQHCAAAIRGDGPLEGYGQL